ncbi:PilZ domain-containing protein [Erythrobacter sp. HL-111]|uniref:PilZ domain-containing protein n=1 Tax=Erythrobacter sp. HL-111 TaxID=1798193 RepID=UPI0006D944F9|nr:PilZ domain-containing protein [Erythrobacter sp. HL-111]KPP88362.1 MAG: PilZ domain [Erythrobacteraceae bacterium HL-111]SDS81123.1 PilZ domain-containing protein [Erythrobacter sp. HL-111]
MEQAASDPWPRGEAASGSAAEASAEPPGTSAQSGPAAASAPDPAPADPGADMRAAPRFTLLIRAAKLVCAKGEFVCVIRDVSETGVSVRLFHRLPSGGPYELHMPGGVAYEMRAVWQRDNEAGFEFTRPVEVSRLISEAGQYPKRGIRLDLFFPITIRTLAQQCEGVVENISQQGARFECDGLFAIDQTLRIEGTDLGGAFRKEVRVKVRWRRARHYGVVFDDTFTLGDFARLAAQLQEPALLRE